MIRWLAIFLLWSGVACAQMSGGAMFPGPGTVHSTGGGGCTPGANATLTLARLSGSVSTTDVCTLINALDTAGVYTKIDLLAIYATASSADAIINWGGPIAQFTGTITATALVTSGASGAAIAIGQLVTGPGVTAGTLISGGSGSTWTVNNSQTVGPVTMQGSCWPQIVNGSPTFTANAGYTGAAASTTKYIDSRLSPAAPVGCALSYVQDSAHVSGWSLSSSEISPSASGGVIIGSVSGGGNNTRVFPNYNSTNQTYSDVNSGTQATGISNTSTLGQFLVNRSGASAVQHYINGSSVGSSTEASVGLLSANIYILAQQSGGSSNFGGGFQIAAATIGGKLTSTEVSDLKNAICTYLTAVHGSC